MHEWLYAYPSGRAQSWIERAWDAEEQQYQWGRMEALKGQKKLWRGSTRENALFLSQAVQLNCKQLQPVFDWFQRTLRIIGIRGVTRSYTKRLCSHDEHKKNLIVKFLQGADLNVVGLEIKKNTLDESDFVFPDHVPEAARKRLMQDAALSVQLHHRGDGDSIISFDLDDESDGTQKLFAFAGPLLDVLGGGSVLFVDELHGHLHPLIVKMLVGLVNNSETNPNNAQLVFTTHETSILSQNVFRRDQIWLADQEHRDGTELTPLSDFRVRKQAEDIERFYLDGRYGAVPYLNGLYREFAEAMETLRGHG